MLNSLLKRALGLERTVIEGARIEGDSIIVSVRPRRAAPRCPVCGRRCAAYDRLGPRRWRAPDLGAARCYLEHAPVRASCWIGNTYLDDSGRDSPASLNSTGDM